MFLAITWLWIISILIVYSAILCEYVFFTIVRNKIDHRIQILQIINGRAAEIYRDISIPMPHTVYMNFYNYRYLCNELERLKKLEKPFTPIHMAFIYMFGPFGLLYALSRWFHLFNYDYLAYEGPIFPVEEINA